MDVMLSRDSMFSVTSARNSLIKLTSYGPRTIGSTANEVTAPEVILGLVRDAVKGASSKAKIEIEVQHPSGQFFNDFLGGINNVCSLNAFILLLRSH